MKLLILVLAIAYCTATGVYGQLFDTSAAQTELVATLMGPGRVFTANVTVKREKGEKQITLANNVMFMRNGDICLEHKLVDDPALAKLTTRLKRNHLDEITTILLARDNKACLLFPGKHTYIVSPSEQTAAPHIESTLLRTETIAGHLCTVRRINVTGEDDSYQQLTIWEATDLRGFIIKSKMNLGDDTNEILLFTNILTEKPDDAKFAIPPDYSKLSEKSAAEIAKLMLEVDLERDAAIAEALR